MAFDCNSNHRKPLLFSDLFKNHRNTAMEKDVVISASSASASSSSSSTQFLSSWDSSSSSGFSTPLHSDLGSSEGNDADFIAELTRQMAEYMLEEEETAAAVDHVYQASSRVKSSADESYGNSGAVKSGFYSSSVRVDDPTQPNIQVYELKNQPPVSKEGLNRRRRVRGTQSAQQKQMQKTEQQYKQYRGREWGGGVAINGYSGSGMQAVFLGGSGSRSGFNGTGVFLPRDPTELKNKTGCSMVLMPTRVLQVLEQHFSKIQQDSNAPPLCDGSLRDEDESPTSNGPHDESPESEIQPADGDEMQLPQEWTY